MKKFNVKEGRYVISVVAELLNIHPQTLRIYEKRGLINPVRKEGRQRLYSDEDLERIKVIRNLTEELGINLAGVEVILSLREQIFSLQKGLEEKEKNSTREIGELKVLLFKFQKEMEEKEKRFIREMEYLRWQLQQYQPKFLPKPKRKKTEENREEIIMNYE